VALCTAAVSVGCGVETTGRTTSSKREPLLTTTAGPPAGVVVVSGSLQSALLNTAFGEPFVAKAVDAQGTGVPGVIVTFLSEGNISTGPGAILSTASAVTDAAGLATTTATANAFPGEYRIDAVTAGTVAKFTVSNSSSAPASMALYVGSPQSAPVGTAFGKSLEVRVMDSGGNSVHGAMVLYAAPSTGATATVRAWATTDATGLAGTQAVAGTVASDLDTPSYYQVTAAISGLTPVTFDLTNTTGAPAYVLADSGSEQSATVATAYAGPLVARVTDSYGNPVKGATVAFTAPGTGASASLSSPAATGNDGRTSVTAAANTVSGGFSVGAEVGGSITTTFALTNTAGSP
jgi:hypothetical protein